MRHSKWQITANLLFREGGLQIQFFSFHFFSFLFFSVKRRVTILDDVQISKRFYGLLHPWHHQKRWFALETLEIIWEFNVSQGLFERRKKKQKISFYRMPSLDVSLKFCRMLCKQYLLSQIPLKMWVNGLKRFPRKGKKYFFFETKLIFSITPTDKKARRGFCMTGKLVNNEKKVQYQQAADCCN